MVKKSKIRYALPLLLLLVLLSCTYLPNTACASEESSQAKTLYFLKNVAGINTTGLKTSINDKSLTTLWGLSQEETDLTLSYNGNSLRARCSFINGKFYEIYLSNQTETLDFAKKTTDTINSAKTLIEQYEQYTGDSFYGSLASMLDNEALSLNCSTTSGNIKLEISTFGDSDNE